MSYRLHHDVLSAPSRTVRLLLAEYGLEAEGVQQQLWQRDEAFLRLNPAASLPVLEDGGTVVVGAQVVLEYLDETRGALKGDHRLVPEGAAARAEMRRLVDWSLVKLETEVTRYAVHERVTKRLIPREAGGGTPDSQALRAARTNIRFHLQYLGWIAGQRHWMAGEALSHADLAVAGALSVLDYLGEIEWSEEGPLRDWYARMKSRPSFRPLLADRVRGLPPVSHYADLDF